MIPWMAIVGFRTQKHRIFRLWIPLFLIWLLLLPVVLVLLPLVFIALAVVRINPFRAFRTGWQFLTALKGTYVEVNQDDAFVLLRIF
jgi:hypothetical protein